jgi:hypothetical protein
MKDKAELLVDKLKKDLFTIKKAESTPPTFEDGYLITYEELELIVNYIKNLRVASGRKP